MTNEIPAANNTWTLLKHMAGSANKAAGKIDQHIYGKIEKHSNQTVIIQQVRPPRETHWYEPVIAVVGVLLFVGILIAFMAGKISGRDILGI